MGIKCPYYNCPQRLPGCHSNCENYKTFREELNEINKKESQERFLNYSIRKMRRFS